MEAKVVVGTEAVERNPEFGTDIVWHWRELADAHRREGGLDGVWSQMCITDDRLEAGIAAGALVEDDRLVEFLES